MYCYMTGINKKPSESKSEDLVGSNNNFYWLLDGATPPAERKYKELTQIFLNTFNSALSACSLECSSTNILLERSLERVRDVFTEKYDINSLDHLPSSTAVIIKIDGEIEYSVLGDSYLSIATKNSKIVITDERIGNIAVNERKIVREMRENGVDENSIEYIKARKALIREESNLRNVAGGYWIASLNPLAAEESIYGTYPLDSYDDFLIFAASDGLTRLVTHLGAFNDLYSLADETVRVGATQIFKKLRELESDKTNFIKPISNKHDDASFLLISSNYV